MKALPMVPCCSVREAVQAVVDAQSLPRVARDARQAGDLPRVPVFAVPSDEGIKGLFPC